MLKDTDFYHLLAIYLKIYRNQLLDSRLDSLKTAAKKAVHTIDELLVNKIADAITNLYDNKNVKTKPIKELINSPEKREVISKELRQALEKWNAIKSRSY